MHKHESCFYIFAAATHALIFRNKMRLYWSWEERPRVQVYQSLDARFLHCACTAHDAANGIAINFCTANWKTIRPRDHGNYNKSVEVICWVIVFELCYGVYCSWGINFVPYMVMAINFRNACFISYYKSYNYIIIRSVFWCDMWNALKLFILTCVVLLLLYYLCINFYT